MASPSTFLNRLSKCECSWFSPWQHSNLTFIYCFSVVLSLSEEEMYLLFMANPSHCTRAAFPLPSPDFAPLNMLFIFCLHTFSLHLLFPFSIPLNSCFFWKRNPTFPSMLLCPQLLLKFFIILSCLLSYFLPFFFFLPAWSYRHPANWKRSLKDHQGSSLQAYNG